MSEKALAFGPERALVGVWTEPRGAAEANGLPAVLMINSGIVHHAGIWRLHVRLARALAARGFPSLRFDLSGIGDSDPARGSASLAELVVRDVDAALDHVRKTRGIERVVVMGLCSGAQDSLDAATRDPQVVGTVAVDLIGDLVTWQHQAVHVGKRLLNADGWRNAITRLTRGRLRPPSDGGSVDEADGPGQVGPFLGIRDAVPRGELQRELTALLARGMRLLFVFSAGLEDNYNHASQFREALPELARHPNLASEFFPRADHTFSNAEQQAALIERVVEWMTAQFGAAPVGTPGPDS